MPIRVREVRLAKPGATALTMSRGRNQAWLVPWGDTLARYRLPLTFLFDHQCARWVVSSRTSEGLALAQKQLAVRTLISARLWAENKIGAALPVELRCHLKINPVKRHSSFATVRGCVVQLSLFEPIVGDSRDGIVLEH